VHRRDAAHLVRARVRVGARVTWRAAQMIGVAPSIVGIFAHLTAMFAAALSAASSSDSASVFPFLAASTTSFVS